MPLFFPSLVRALDANGNPMPLATWTFYRTGTLDLVDVYTTADLDNVHSNPVTANGGGLFPLIYLDPGIIYRAVLQPAGGGDAVRDADPYNESLFAAETASLFTTLALGLTPKPTGSTTFRTTGHSEAGVGQAYYVNSDDVDEAYFGLHPKSSFLWADGSGAKLAEVIRTPYMFGCAGIREGDTDTTMADDHEGLQAFFNDAFHIENRAFTYDFSGDWATSEQLYASYPLDQDGTIWQDQAQRRFIDGKIRALPLTRQPDGEPMDYILTISGYSQRYSGRLHLSGISDTGPTPTHPYANRRAKNALRLIGVNFSHFDKIFVEGVQRDGVYFDPALVETTLREGTPYEVTYPYSNNIGTRIDYLFGRWVGAYYGTPATYQKNWSAMAHGGLSAGVFDPTPASYANSTNQRTKLTFATTEDFRVGDYGKVRLELGTSDYGTIAADATASTLTWSTGDPVAKGLAAGDVIIPRSGANAGKRLEILSFSGTSNRVILVSPRLQTEAGSSGLTTETATAVTGLDTKWAPYLVMSIPSATEVLIWPWMEDRLGSTGKWTFMHGHVANITGNNTANVAIGTLVGLAVSSTCNAQTLYGPNIGTILAEFSEIGAVIGSEYGNVHLGTVIEQMHAEGCEFNVIQTTSSNNCHVNIKGGSNLYMSRLWMMISKVAAGDTFMPIRPMNFITLDLGGQLLVNRQATSYSGTAATSFTVTNRPEQRQIVKAMNGPITATLDFGFETARLAGNHHWAEIHWIGPTGAAPTSTLTFALSTELTLRGWTIEGTNPISGPTKPCKVHIVFYSETKKVLLSRYDAA